LGAEKERAYTSYRLCFAEAGEVGNAEIFGLNVMCGCVAVSACVAR
jgi:hypothetical protein